jgi:succinoglycan biosynthesis protein ExoU
MEDTPSVAVIIAARNMAAYIERAVRSALAEPEVAEVWVMDDASNDQTAAVARQVDDDSGRLYVVELARNVGPSAARNLAIRRTRCPYVAILDADDLFLSGRFARMFAAAGQDWDLLADNMVSMHEGSADLAGVVAGMGSGRICNLDVASFVTGNLPQRRVDRGELGFLKPVMRKAFLEQQRLSYREDVWLGEDYVLYVEAMLAGGRFRVVDHLGYFAVERAQSLSGSHGPERLVRLTEVGRELLARAKTPASRVALQAHLEHGLDKVRYIEVIELARRDGRLKAVAALLATPRRIPFILSRTLRDKLARWRESRPDAATRRRPARILLGEKFFLTRAGG